MPLDATGQAEITPSAAPTAPETPQIDLSADLAGRGEQGSTLSAADSAVSAPSAPNSGAAPAPTDPNLAAAARPAPQTATNDWRGVREAAEALGVRFGGNVRDDNQALAELVRQSQANKQADYYAQLGRQLAPQAPAIQQYLAQQQAPAPANEWDRPDFDDRWAALVDRDPATGMYVGKPGAPPELVAKVNAYANWSERYAREPEGFIAYHAEKVADQVFERRLTEFVQRSQESQAVEQIRSANAGWLYQHDGQGGYAYGHNGRPVLSPAGQRYAHHVQNVIRMGVTDPRYQDQLARQALQAEIAMASQASQQQQAQRFTPQTLAAQAAPNANPLGALGAVQRDHTPGAPESTQTGMTLQQMMRAEIAREGLSEADFDVFANR